MRDLELFGRYPKNPRVVDEMIEEYGIVYPDYVTIDWFRKFFNYDKPEIVRFMKALEEYNPIYGGMTSRIVNVDEFAHFMFWNARLPGFMNVAVKMNEKVFSSKKTWKRYFKTSFGKLDKKLDAFVSTRNKYIQSVPEDLRNLYEDTIGEIVNMSDYEMTSIVSETGPLKSMYALSSWFVAYLISNNIKPDDLDRMEKDVFLTIPPFEVVDALFVSILINNVLKFKKDLPGVRMIPAIFTLYKDLVEIQKKVTNEINEEDGEETKGYFDLKEYEDIHTFTMEHMLYPIMKKKMLKEREEIQIKIEKLSEEVENLNEEKKVLEEKKEEYPPSESEECKNTVDVTEDPLPKFGSREHIEMSKENIDHWIYLIGELENICRINKGSIPRIEVAEEFFGKVEKLKSESRIYEKLLPKKISSVHIEKRICKVVNSLRDLLSRVSENVEDEWRETFEIMKSNGMVSERGEVEIEKLVAESENYLERSLEAETSASSPKGGSVAQKIDYMNKCCEKSVEYAKKGLDLMKNIDEYFFVE